MVIRRLWSTVSAAALIVLILAAVPACTAAAGKPAGKPAAAGAAATTGPRVSPMTDISAGCAGNSSEVEEAFAPPAYVYAEWIGCDGIGFARSTDSGRHFGAAMTVPGSRGASWDPAITVAADGTVYAAFMHGAGRMVRTVCGRGASCSYAAGDLNIVLQASGDGGATWGPLVHLEPGFPLGGGYSAPLIVAPDGHVDVLYDAHPTSPGSDAVHPGYEYFTSSPDGTHWTAAPRPLGPGQGTLSRSAWWIDGDISADAAGNLYATWDTQTAAGDIGWLTYSQDGGLTWSVPLRVTPDHDQAPHIVESVGGRAGVAYIAWQTSAPAAGYATYLRPFSIPRGWLGPAIKVSAAYGNARIWPGDTFGLALLPDGRISMTWGSATGTSKASAIYASVVTT